MLLKGVGLLVHLPNPQALRRRRQDILPVALDIGYPHHLGWWKIMFELINLMKAVLWLPQIQIHDIDLIVHSVGVVAGDRHVELVVLAIAERYRIILEVAFVSVDLLGLS